jgi:hypothetical protein
MNMHIDGGSQVSPVSIVPLPQVDEQLLSEAEVHPDGQQPSPLMHDVMGVWPHDRLQFAALPVDESIVHEFMSSQVGGQVAGGSQVSPGSSTPLPQLAEQLLSVIAVQPPGQQPSPLMHDVIVV